MIFRNNKTYDTLKNLSLIAIPISTFIVAILGAYNYGNVERVTAVLAAINTLLGSLVKISSSEYNKK
ncbi:phage holin [Anaerococcus sp. mt242]|uniref:phage holin n=1 Tax=Anaerococcus sp. mt242 TaxID=2661917 RepID=UPI0019318B70|nr:phage holin [Anaerococcus sp. mt242]MBM0047129.1 hypothetical protein [Anaerococcus sp. mt242]